MKKLIFGLLCLSLIGCLEQTPTDNNDALDTVDLDAESVDGVVEMLDKTSNDLAEESAEPGLVQNDGTCILRREVSSREAKGFVQLKFNNEDCSIANDGDVVNRTYDLTFTNKRNQKLLVTSERQENYAGEILGGGGYLENTASGWVIEVDGRNQEFYGRRGRKLVDVSIETGAPIEIQGTLNRDNRVITSGQILVHHNLAKFTASYASRGLTWDGTCKCPVAGTLHADYFNRIRKRSSEIEFKTCGYATITFDNGDSRDLKLRRCFE